MRVTPPDLELWLTGYVRALAAAESVELEVGNKEPPDLEAPLDVPLVVIRVDSATRLEQVTFDCTIGASVVGGSKQNDQPINDVARWLAGVLFDLDLPLVEDSPLAAVVPDGCNGPYAVTEQLDVARRYMTAQYIVVGSW